jgi:Cyclin, C-terminal domain
MNWRPMIPTPIDFVKLLLFYSNITQDFTDIILRTADECFTALALIETATVFSPSTIALAALMVVLEDLEFATFQNDIATLIV